jgi:endonuclease/exonuclease/phosphatase (EEP) superfamily protein YafD
VSARLETALLVVGFAMVAATVLPLSRSEAWWVRVFDFPRVQISVVAAAAAVAYAATASRIGDMGIFFLGSVVLCLIYQAYMIAPYTPLFRKQSLRSDRPLGDSSIRLTIANVYQYNRNARGFLDVVREADPDVVLVLETDAWWKEQLSELEQTYPHTVFQPQENTYGMLLYSRFELIDPKVDYLIEDGIPSIHTAAKLPSGVEVSLHCMHPKPPFPTEDPTSTQRDVELVVLAKAIQGSDVPTIVMGDLNDVAWSRTNYLFQDISGLLDPRIGRGFYNSFHAKYPFMRFPLDHFFHSRHFKVVSVRRLARFGSDHFPMYLALNHEPEAKMEQERLRPTADEQEEADEKAAEAPGRM